MVTPLSNTASSSATFTSVAVKRPWAQQSFQVTA
jgi:hypothetical protein